MSRVVAIEGGGTRSRAGLYDLEGELLKEAVAGPANPVACGLGSVADTVLELLRGLGDPEDIALFAGLAGVYTDDLRTDAARMLVDRTAGASVFVTTDVHPVLAANTMTAPGILVVAGTGSNVLACAPAGEVLQVGGRGTLLGDEGSSYGIAVAALRATARALDGLDEETVLAATLPEAAGLSDFADFVRWGMTASKTDIAALARVVLVAAEAGDPVAQGIVGSQARALAAQIIRAQGKLGADTNPPVYTIGALLENDTCFARELVRRLEEDANLKTMLAPLAGHRAVFELSRLGVVPDWAARVERASLATALPVTEGMDTVHPPLDSLSAQEIVHVMNDGDAAVLRAIGACADVIAQVVEMAAAAIHAGGRILYTGAGTSGRLGVLDASECPPTFGIPSERVVGIIAGGEPALRHSVEGAEDDRDLAVRDLDALLLTEHDLLVGIAASGTTPYVLAGLEAATARGVATALVCCNPRVCMGADVIVALDTGAEVLPGSTRLKAGTATKMVLNMITTGAMARAGYVVDGLMAGMTPKNVKLRERAERIVVRLAGVETEVAREALAAAAWHIGHAVLIARDEITSDEAISIFARADGNLRRALHQR